MSWWVILLYVLAITSLCVGVVLFFVVKNKKDKKRLEKLKEHDNFDANMLESVSLGNGKQTLDKEESNFENSQNINQINDNKIQESDFVLEDFSLDKETNQQKKLLDKARDFRKNNITPNDFDQTNFLSENEDIDDELPEGFEDDSLLDDFEQDEDDRFRNYEEFLRKHLEENEDEDEDKFFMDDVDDAKNENISLEDDIEALRNFDFSSLENKDEEEISEIIESLPPKAKEILLTDILSRKDEDNE